MSKDAMPFGSLCAVGFAALALLSGAVTSAAATGPLDLTYHEREGTAPTPDVNQIPQSFNTQLLAKLNECDREAQQMVAAVTAKKSPPSNLPEVIDALQHLLTLPLAAANEAYRQPRQLAAIEQMRQECRRKREAAAAEDARDVSLFDEAAGDPTGFPQKYAHSIADLFPYARGALLNAVQKFCAINSTIACATYYSDVALCPERIREFDSILTMIKSYRKVGMTPDQAADEALRGSSSAAHVQLVALAIGTRPDQEVLSAWGAFTSCLSTKTAH